MATDQEILQLLYDETLIGNAPAVRDGVNEGLEQGLGPELWTSFTMNLQALALTVVISLVLSY